MIRSISKEALDLIVHFEGFVLVDVSDIECDMGYLYDGVNFIKPIPKKDDSIEV